jgi:hypothetical protein
MKQRAFFGSVVLLAVVLGVACAATAQTGTQRSLGRLPLYLVENRGVYPDEVRYSIQGSDKTLFFTDGGVTIAFRGKRRGWTVKLDFVGARRDARPVGLDKQPAVFSYFTGPEKDWKAGLPTYSTVIYRNLWPGIDLVYYGTVDKLKYEFVVAPGADPAKIRLRYRGATSVAATEAGTLRVETPEGSFEDARPVAWQETDGKRVPVAMAYELGAPTGDAVEFGFRLGEYDRTRPLVLDPAVIVYCGYVGGAGDDAALDVEIDGSGCAVVVGSTRGGPTFPVTAGPYSRYGGAGDAFVAKVNAQGTALVYCGYIGGDKWDTAFGVAVDGAGNAYVAGSTESDAVTGGFPAKLGPDVTYNGGRDGFVAKVNAQGTALVYCGYIGGSSLDDAFDVATDSRGNAFVAGRAGSDETSFPVRIGPSLSYRGGYHDGFVARVNTAGTGLDYCGYIGGASFDHVTGIAVDGSGRAYVHGYTESKDLPVKVGPDLTHNGGADRFVAKVEASGKSLVYCGYVGGKGADGEYGSRPKIAVDAMGRAYVTGETKATQATFPVKLGPDLTHGGQAPMSNGWDAFVARINAQGTGFEYCGYLGGPHDDHGTGIAVDAAGNAYVCGYTASTESTFPVKVGPDLTHNNPTTGFDAFVVKVNSQGTGIVYGGYVGGSADDFGQGIAVTPQGEAFVAGYTSGSTEKTFPEKVGPDLTYNGMSDAFVARISRHDELTAAGNAQPGGTVSLALDMAASPGLAYCLGTALGSGPIPIDTRWIGLDADGLLVASTGGLLPAIFQGYAGRLDRQGKASAAIHLPNESNLVGTDLHSAFVTLDPSWPSAIRSISQTCSFRIVR